MDITEAVKILAESSGVSGAESEFTAAERLLGEYATVRRTPLGSLIATVGQGERHILLDAHMDRIGLIVTAVDDSGFIRFDKCGGCDVRVLAAAEVTVHGKKELPGVITSTPPHLAGAEDKDKAPLAEALFVDVGLSYEEEAKLVQPGDRITIDSPITLLRPGIITGAALDNRLGMGVLLGVLAILRDKKLNMRVSVMFSVQEETTESGARTGAFAAAPDEAIVVDVSFGEAPGIPPAKCGKMGKGPMICVSSVLSAKMWEDLTEIAEKKGIEYQTEVCPTSTGTNAEVIAVAGIGVKTGLVSVPIKNMHTQAELAHISDAEAAAQLIAEYILAKGETANA